MLSFVTTTVTACANFSHLPDDTGDFDAIANRDRPLRENDETTDEIARDILQTEADADADRARKDRQRLEVNAGVLQDDENANDKDDVGDDLRDCVLERAIEPAMDEEAIEEKALRTRRNPEDEKEQRNEQKNLHQADRDAWDRRRPCEGNPERVDCADGKKDDGDGAEDRRDDRDEIAVELEPAEQPPNERALNDPGDDEPENEKPNERGDAEDGDVTAGQIEDRIGQPEKIHALFSPRKA